MAIDEADLAGLREAVEQLESVRWPIRVAHFLGKPVEMGLDRLPREGVELVHRATDKALGNALDLAIWSLGRSGRLRGSPLLYKSAATLAGGAGGAFGWPALMIELPISTTIMLRAIADLARAEGEQLTDPETRLQCLTVFALGSPSSKDNAAESGYFAVRAALAQQVVAAAKHVAAKGAGGKAAPPLLKLLSAIASRFSIAVSEKAVAQALPILGAAGGATLNLLFIAHFQDVAHGHFTIRRLERKYDRSTVHEAYQQLRREIRQQEDQPRDPLDQTHHTNDQ